MGGSGRPHTRQQLARSADGLIPGDAYDPLAAGLEDGLTLDIVLARELAVVPSGAVSLDDEALSRPAEVGNDPSAQADERLVDIRVRQPAAQQQVQHQILELAAGRRRAGRDQIGKLPRAAMSKQVRAAVVTGMP